MPKPGSRLAWGWVAIAFLIGFANYPMQVVGWKFDQLPGDPIDNRLNNFILEHGYRWLSGQVEYLWDAPSFYPKLGVTAWSDAHIGMLPLYAAVRVLGGSPEQAFQGHFLLACVLNFAAAAWAIRRLGFSPIGVAAGAYVFTFGLPIVGQTQHTQLIPRFLVPLAFVFSWEFLRSPRTWRLAIVAACCVGQLYLTVYIGYFLVLLLAAEFAIGAARFPRSLPWRDLVRPGWRTWAYRVAVAGVALGAALPLVDRHTRASSGGLPPELIRDMAPVPASWITMSKNAYLHPASPWSPLPEVKPPEGEHLMCPGLVLIVVSFLVALRGVLPIATDTTRVAVLAAWVTLFLALAVTRLGDVWLYQPLLSLPGSGGIRVPGRVVLILLFPAGIALAQCIDSAVRFARRAGSVPGFLTAFAVLAIVLADQRLMPVENHDEEWFFYHNRLDVVLARQARLTEAIKRHPSPSFVFVFPSAGDGAGGSMGLQPEVMRATQDLGIPCVNGWTGYLPPGWGYFANYRELMTWLTVNNDTPPEQLAGMVVVGEPEPDKKPLYEARMRALYPPQRLRKLSEFVTGLRPLVHVAGSR